MKRLSSLLLALLPLWMSAQSSIDDSINAVMEPVTNAIMKVIFFTVPVGGGMEVPFVLIWLLAGALIFTVYNRFVNLTAFRHALDVVRGKFDDPNHKGEVSHFQALTAALSGTVGVGNIAGVAVAVSLGGPGATFWMIVAGLLGMSSKFVECTLGTKYRRVNSDGSVSGGPMYYLRDGLANQNKKGLGAVLAALFAIACIGGSFGGGNMVQINQATSQLIVYSVIQLEGVPFTVYPNPARDVVQLEMNETALDAVMSIYDASGRLMWSRTAERWTGRFAVDVSNWSAGTYHVQVATAQGVGHAPLVVQH